MGEARRRKLAGEPDHGVGVPVLSWGGSGKVVDIDELIANRPALIKEVEYLFINRTPAPGVWARTPRKDVSVIDAKRILDEYFPGLEFVSKPKSELTAFATRMVGEDPMHEAGTDVYNKLPQREGEKHLLLIESDSANEFVDTHLLLYGLAQYVNAVAADLKPAQKSNFTGLPCYIPAMALLASLPEYRARYPDPRSMPYQDVLNAAAFFTGYALAHYLDLDPRVMSYGLMNEQVKNPMLRGLILAYIGDLAYVVGIPAALGNFIKTNVGVSRDEFFSRNESFRVATVAKASGKLLSYSDGTDMQGTGATGGKRWLPMDESANKEPVNTKKAENAFGEVVELVFDEMYQAARKSLIAANGQTTATILIPFMRSVRTIVEPGEPFLPGLLGADENEFIGRHMSNPNCLWILRVSEAWATTPTGKFEVILFRFISHHFRAQAVCPIKRNPTDLVRGALRFE